MAVLSLYCPYLTLRIDISAVCNQCVDNITVSVGGGPYQCCAVVLRWRQHDDEQHNTDNTTWADMVMMRMRGDGCNANDDRHTNINVV